MKIRFVRQLIDNMLRREVETLLWATEKLLKQNDRLIEKCEKLVE